MHHKWITLIQYKDFIYIKSNCKKCVKFGQMRLILIAYCFEWIARLPKTLKCHLEN